MESNLAIRKLAAIVVADVVGFSRHMELDDAGTLARLREIREQLIDPRIAKYNGHVVKTAGDGMLIEFGSADAALRCAIEVQRAMSADTALRLGRFFGMDPQTWMNLQTLYELEKATLEAGRRIKQTTERLKLRDAA